LPGAPARARTARSRRPFRRRRAATGRAHARVEGGGMNEAALSTRPTWRRLGVFFELGKMKIVELWLGFFVGVSLLGRDAVRDPRAIAILGLILVAGICVIAATCSLDDIAGVRDGV